MIAYLICLAAVAMTFFSARRSLGNGLIALLVVGYTYGIIRANIPESASHFIFDAAALGLYLGAFTQRATGSAWYRSVTLEPWVTVLVGWPLLLFFIPVQDWAIQLVGLRGAIFFVPLLLIGARMKDPDFNTLANGLSVLNLIELAMGLLEFFTGVERFYPRNAVTGIIYASNDAGGGALRIPATFVASAAYGTVMALTMPMLAGAWAQHSGTLWRRRLLEAGMIASGLGVFLSASRTNAILLACSVVGIFVSVRLKASHRIGIVAALLVVGWFVAKNPRLQRFMTLRDTDYVERRIGWSVNATFLDALQDYPMGNGLGGGGTSIPYFLSDRLRNPVLIENEYGRILLEQGILGLIIWIGFVCWLLMRSFPLGAKRWYLGRLLLWGAVAFLFVGGAMGTGMLTSIPASAILMVGSGWLISRRREEERALRHAMLPGCPLPEHLAWIGAGQLPSDQVT